MSRVKTEIIEIEEFIDRFVEVCGTSKPAEIAQLFKISYQAAKNYLDGRLPDTNVLISISRNTSFSLHWLLTGTGPKFINEDADNELLSDEMRALIRDECERIVAAVFKDQVRTAKEKVIVLSSKDIKEEKVIEENSPISLNQS